MKMVRQKWVSLKRLWLLLLIFFLAVITQAEDVIYEDFEGIDYGSWVVTGTAFGTGPAEGALPNQNPVSGYEGARLVNTFLGGDAPTGTLTSPDFVISRDYIHFLIGGGNHPNQTCINLIVGGNVERTATGADNETLSWVFWDVSGLAGQTAKLEIVDSYTGGWGHVNVDHITFGDSTYPPIDIIYENFEATGYGSWVVTGTAFGTGPAEGTLPNQNIVSGYQGVRLVNTFLGGDGPTGTLTSPDFVISRDYIHFLIGGGNHPNQTCINLIVGGNVERTATGADNETLSWAFWDVSGLAGQTAKLEIVDSYTGGWGHVNIDYITFSNGTVPPNPVSYYVATSGNDSNSGTFAAPFATIQKAASVVKAGDTVYIQGGTYRETVTPAQMGKSGAPITFAAYNNEKVIISGCDVVSGWTVHSGDIWKAAVNWTVRDGIGDTVFVDGSLKFEGRYPSTTDMMDRSSWGAMSSIDTALGAWMTANDLKGFGDDYWNGYKIRNHFTNWTLKDHVIADYESSTGKVTYEVPYGYAPQYWTSCRNYFIYGGLKVIDAPGEWFKDNNTNTLYYHVSPGQNPNTDIEIEFKKRSYAFDLASRDHIQIHGIEFRGASIITDGSTDYNVYEGNLFVAYDKGGTGYGRWGISGTGNLFKSNEVKQTWGGIGFGGIANQCVNNYFHDNGYSGGNNGSLGISGSDHLISYNTFSNIGRNVAQPKLLARCEIEYNLFEDCGNITTDTGAIEWNDMGNTVFHHNVFRNNTDAAYPFSGFYGGGNPDNIVFHHNILYNCGGNPHHAAGSAGFVLHVNNTYIDGNCRISGGGLLHTSKFINNIHLDYYGFRTNIYELEGNHLYKDSDFVNAGARDYRLAPGSGAVDTGVIVPGITETYVGSAPDAGALEYGEAMFKVGYDFANPPSPVYDWLQTPGMNLVPDTGIDSLGDWNVTGSPVTVVANAWNVGLDALGLNGTHSICLSNGDKISQVFDGLKPNTWYNVASKARILGDVVQVETYSSGSRTFALGSERGETGITGVMDGEWVCFDNVNFGNTEPYYDRIELLYSYGTKDQSIEVRLDSVTGLLLGTMNYNIVQTTTWKTAGASIDLPDVTGTHSLYLVARGSSPQTILDEIRYMDVTLKPGDEVVMGVRNFGNSESGTEVSSRLGAPYWLSMPESMYFKTGPSATSAEIYFECNDAVLDGYLDCLFLYESVPAGYVISGDGTASQSSTAGSNAASYAIDGIILGGINSETTDAANSWWQLDLGESKEIYEILLTAPESNPGRLSNFRVSVWSEDPDNEGIELWGRDYLASETFVTGQTLLVKGNELSDNNSIVKLQDVRGKIVSVQLNGNNNEGTGVLPLAEVQVVEHDYSNQAMVRGIASQSSTDYGGVASRAIDGNTNPDYTAGSVTHTQDQANSWWQVNFVIPETIGKIIITNREGSTADRLSNFQVSAWDGDPDNGGTKLWSQNYYQTGNVSSGGQLIIEGDDIDQTTGYIRLASLATYYLRIQLNGQNNAGNGFLSLAEVQIYNAADNPPENNIALQGIPRQSSNNGYGNEGQPLDGDVYAIYSWGSCNRTINEYEPWWQVDLQQTQKIDQIVFVPRLDSGGISNYRISIWNGDPEEGGSIELWGRTYPGPTNTTLYINGSDLSDSGTKLQDVVGSRFVRLQVVNNNATIIFCEMQVWQHPETLTGAFREIGGTVCMEAENYNSRDIRSDANNWAVENSISGFVGIGYAIVPDNTTSIYTFEDCAKMAYKVNFSTAGTYAVYVRRNIPDTAGNSAYAAIDGIQSSGIDNTGDYNQWVWKSLGTVAVSSVGVKYVNIVKREDGYAIDRIVLTTGSAPTGNGPAESSRVIAAKHEAENYTAQAGTTITMSAPGYTGTGFVDYSSNCWIEWNNVEGGAGSSANLVFRYANGSTSDRTCNIILNSTQAGTLSFAPTGSWSDWQTQSLNVILNVGNNTIRVLAPGNGPNLDNMSVQ